MQEKLSFDCVKFMPKVKPMKNLEITQQAPASAPQPLSWWEKLDQVLFANLFLASKNQRQLASLIKAAKRH